MNDLPTNPQSSKSNTDGLTVEVWCTLQFESVHCWPDAPDAVFFLRTPHRHVFHAKLWFEVSHDDRDIEFILAKRRAEEFVGHWRNAEQTLTWSCERWATELLNEMGAGRVEVSEDGENGALVSRKE